MTSAGKQLTKFSIRAALDILDERGTEAHAFHTIEDLLNRPSTSNRDLLREVISGLGNHSKAVSVKARCKLAVRVFQSPSWKGGDLCTAVAWVVEQLCDQVVKQPQQPASSTAEELDRLASQSVYSLLQVLHQPKVYPETIVSSDLLLKSAFLPVLNAALRAPERNNTIGATNFLKAMMCRCRDWICEQKPSPPCRQILLAAVAELLEAVLGKMQGLPFHKLASMLLTVELCVDVIGCQLEATTAKRAMRFSCTHLKNKEDWQVRQQAAQTLATLYNAAAGNQGEPHVVDAPPAAEVLLRNQDRVAQALKDTKHDRIEGVRKAVACATIALDTLVELYPEIEGCAASPIMMPTVMKNCPNPKGSPKISKHDLVYSSKRTPPGKPQELQVADGVAELVIGSGQSTSKQKSLLARSPASWTTPKGNSDTGNGADPQQRGQSTQNRGRVKGPLAASAAKGSDMDFGIQIFASPAPKAMTAPEGVPSQLMVWHQGAEMDAADGALWLSAPQGKHRSPLGLSAETKASSSRSKAHIKSTRTSKHHTKCRPHAGPTLSACHSTAAPACRNTAAMGPVTSLAALAVLPEAWHLATTHPALWMLGAVQAMTMLAVMSQRTGLAELTGRRAAGPSCCNVGCQTDHSHPLSLDLDASLASAWHLGTNPGLVQQPTTSQPVACSADKQAIKCSGAWRNVVPVNSAGATPKTLDVGMAAWQSQQHRHAIAAGLAAGNRAACADASCQLDFKQVLMRLDHTRTNPSGSCPKRDACSYDEHVAMQQQYLDNLVAAKQSQGQEQLQAAEAVIEAGALESDKKESEFAESSKRGGYYDRIRALLSPRNGAKKGL